MRKTLVSPTLFGRAQELELIHGALQSTQQSRGQCLVISGDAGIGKSRLTAAAREAAGEAQFDLLYGVCFEQDKTLPYGPWIYAIRQYFSRCSPEQIRHALGDSAPEMTRLIPELGAFLHVEYSAHDISPEAEKWRLFEAVVRLLGHITAKRPLLIVLEDLHWGDETSLDLLQYCTRRFSASPILMIGTYRPEDLSPQLKRFLNQMNRERLFTEIRLNPLSRHNLAEMIRAIFEIERPIKLDFLDLIAQLTGGNPFFVEEVLKSLVESGGIYYANGTWERRPVVELQVPSSTRDAVQSRLETLSGPARQLVTLMSVAGRESTFDLLQALTHMEEGELIGHLKELIDAQLIVETTPDLFAFRHELTREAVYAGLMQRERRVQHARIAETVEAVFAGSLETYEASLAMHYERSGQWEKARQYALRAGDKALALYAPREAFEHFTQAMIAAEHLSLPPDLNLHRSRGRAGQLLGNFDSAFTDFEICLGIARESGDLVSEWQALLDLGLLMEGRDYPRADAYNQRALEIARQTGEPRMIGRSLIRKAIWCANMDRSDEGYAAAGEALQCLRALDDPQGLAMALVAQGNLDMNRGGFREGTESYLQAIPLFKETGDLQGQFDCLINLSLCGALDLYYTEPPMMSISRARRYAENALDISRQMASPSDETIAMTRLGMILRTQGRYAQALEMVHHATEIAEGLDHSEWASFGWGALAEIHRDLLNLDLAKECYERSLEYVDRSGNLEIKYLIMANLARVYMDLGELVHAEELLDAASPSENCLRTMAQRLVKYGYARLALERNQVHEAVDILDDLMASSVALSGQEDLISPLLSYMRGDALARMGRLDEGRQALQKASESASQIGGLSLLWRIHLSLARLEAAVDPEQSERELEHARTVITHLAEAIPDREIRVRFIEQADAWLSIHPPAPKEALDGPLTSRELEVVALITAGKSNQEIADQLVLSKRTVEKHISNILSKLALASRAQIIVWGLQNKPQDSP